VLEHSTHRRAAHYHLNLGLNLLTEFSESRIILRFDQGLHQTPLRCVEFRWVATSMRLWSKVSGLSPLLEKFFDKAQRDMKPLG
jgi:hypothetical protein